MKRVMIIFLANLALGFCSITSMDRDMRQDLPDDLMKNEILHHLIKQVDSSGITWNDFARHNHQEINRLQGIEPTPVKEFVDSKKYINTSWHAINKYLLTTKKLASDNALKEKLFIAFVRRLFYKNLILIDVYNDELITIAKNLHILQPQDFINGNPHALSLFLRLYKQNQADMKDVYAEIIPQSLMAIKRINDIITGLNNPRVQLAVEKQAENIKKQVDALQELMKRSIDIISLLMRYNVPIPAEYQEEFELYEDYKKRMSN